MARNFPHMDDTGYPDLAGVDVWKFKNDFDYSQFDNIQMRITVCSVPWDVGVIHVGNAQIPGLGNVVDFGSEAARDRWFDSLTDKFVFDTEYRKFHMEGKGGAVDGTIKLPIPYDVVSRYNYAFVEYTPMPVNLEGQGVKRWHYFIRESHMKAPNTTEVELILDAWQTFIYGVDIPYMMLERGHAPLAALSADTYLSNPMANTRYVTGDDVSYDNHPSIVRSENSIVFNDGDNVYVCIVLDSAVGNSWGTHHTNSWKMPTTHRLTNQGTPNYTCIGMAAANFNDFLTNVDSDFPQFKQAVRAVFFATEKMVTLGDAITMGGYRFNYVQATQRETELLNLDKSKFGFDSKYADIAKLYTFPYSHIEIMDELGNTSIVRVEDTRGQLDIATNLNTVFPFINLTANVLGIGNSSERNVTFKNLGTRQMKFGGKWQDIALNWDVPTFAVVQSNDITNDYATHFDRQQAANDAVKAKANANASASTVKTNSDAVALANYNNANATASMNKTNADNAAATAKTNADSTALTEKTNADNSAANEKTNADLLADTTKTNTDADADTMVANAGLDVACNNTVRSAVNEYLTNQTLFGNATNNRNTLQGNTLNTALMGINTTAQKESAGVSAIGSVVSGALSGSVQGTLGGAVEAVTGYVQAGISIHASQEETAAQNDANNSMNTNQNLGNLESNANAVTKHNIEVNATNTKITGQAANQSATAKANATRTQTANKQVATNTKATENTNAANTYGNALTVNANNKSTANTNAANAYNTATANAQRTYDAATAGNSRTKTTADANAQRDYDNALEAIANQVRQAGLEPTNTFGSIANADTATTRPMAVFAQVVTQSNGAIASAGDEMLRFGYHCNMQWSFNGWNRMKHFTYWKLSDLWINDFRLPDAYADLLRYTLMGGVTVWREPGKIGKVSIYDNL